MPRNVQWHNLQVFLILGVGRSCGTPGGRLAAIIATFVVAGVKLIVVELAPVVCELIAAGVN
jgi:hypothetical protein